MLGVCLDASPFPILEWNDSECNIENQESSNYTVCLALEEILDPMNVGAIMRSAQYFGVDTLFIPKGSSCKLSPIVSKASSGALEVLNIYQVDKLNTFLQNKKAQGWSIVSTTAYNEEIKVPKQIYDVAEISVSQSTILILGNESRGVSPEVQKLCDFFISIPPKKDLHEGIDSLNVSVAAGVILHSLSSKAKNHC
ncbi:rRNA methyltransferase 1, mitochondrial [Caerostris darwini]|uniref:rRNA methyltransferase 1, mitochondrial n=1 Tax=Caerostris darwini TaxID=1538125 RepID=A0AAV4MAS0_9ARAC|nr:rRNA methyltransferase 1, mitochondrial [Caerostris darwini]